MFRLKVLLLYLHSIGVVWAQNITVIETPTNGTEGYSAYLSVMTEFPVNFNMGWRFGSTLIVSMRTGNEPVYVVTYRGRAELYPDNGTLRLDQLTLADTGTYSVTVMNLNTSESKEASIELFVHSALSIIMIDDTVNATHGQSAYLLVMVTFPGTYQFTWKVKDGPVIVTLLNGNLPVYSQDYRSRAELFSENGTLRLDDVVDSDGGSYKVEVFNQDSGLLSEATMQLKVYSRLNKPNVTIIPEVVEQGHIVTFRCSIADGTDTVFSWYKESQSIVCGADSTCSVNSPELHVTSPKESDGGNYRCTVRNPVSSNASDAVELKVYVQISKPTVTIIPLQVKEGDNVTLHCNTTTGNYLNYTWYFNKSVLHCSDQYVCSSESSELIIKSVESANTGNYRCIAENRIHSKTSNLTDVIVNHGPSSMAISASARKCPESWLSWFKLPGTLCIHQSSALNMSCDAYSVPQSNYSWSWNNGTADVNLSKASVLVIESFTNENNGNCTCTASNDVTGKKINQLQHLITYRVPDVKANISCKKISDEKVSVSCSWYGGIPAATVHLQYSDGWENGTEEVNAVASMGRVSCMGQHLFDSSKTTILLQKPVETNPKPKEIIASDGDSVHLLVTLSFGRKKDGSLQSESEEVLPASFKWVHPNDDEFTGTGREEYRISSTAYQSEFVISKFNKTKDYGKYTCTMTNAVGHTDVVFTIQNKQVGTDVGMIVGATIGAVAGVIVIGMAIYFIMKHTKEKEGSQTATNSNDAHISSTHPAEYVNVFANTQQNETQVMNPQEAQLGHIYMSLDQRKDPEYITLDDTRKYENLKWIEHGSSLQTRHSS